MKKLSFEEMENFEGGVRSWSRCVGGFLGLAFLAGAAIAAPTVMAGVLLSGEGAMLAAGITSSALDNISGGC